MKKSKFAIEQAASELESPAGFAHALDLLLLAIGKTHPAAGALLDEFTATHGEYLAELRRLSGEDAQATMQFVQATRQIYRRLSALDSERTSALRATQDTPATSASIH